MTMETFIAEAVRQAVREEIEPLRLEVERLRRQNNEAPVTIAEAARRLGVSRRTIERRLRDGSLGHVQVGNVRRVTLDPTG